MSWHVDGRTIDAYVGGRIDDASAFSLEAHVVACAECRDELSAYGDPALRDRAWDGIRLAIDRPHEGVVERSLRRAGVRSDLARLLVTIPTFRTSWVLAVGICLAFAALATRAIDGGSLPFLVLAPLVPLSGVAAAFGRPIDPVWELGLSAPFGGFRLMLIRAASVLATSIALAGVGALVFLDGGWIGVSWLVPSLALALVVLAVSSTSVSPTLAAGVVGAGWIAGVVLVDRLSEQPLVAFGPLAQLVFALVAVAAAAVLIGRHAAFERPASI